MADHDDLRDGLVGLLEAAPGMRYTVADHVEHARALRARRRARMAASMSALAAVVAVGALTLTRLGDGSGAGPVGPIAHTSGPSATSSAPPSPSPEATVIADVPPCPAPLVPAGQRSQAKLDAALEQMLSAAGVNRDDSRGSGFTSSIIDRNRMCATIYWKGGPPSPLRAAASHAPAGITVRLLTSEYSGGDLHRAATHLFSQRARADFAALGITP